MKKIKPLFLMVLIVGTDQVEEGNVATIAPDGNNVNQLSLQKVLIDETDNSQENDGAPVVRPLSDAENTYWAARQTAAQAAAQSILDSATANIANGTIPNAGGAQ